MFTREFAVPVSDLRGAGPSVSSRLAKMGVFSVADLVLRAPRGYEDRSVKRPLRDFAAGAVNTEAEVLAHDFIGYGRMRTLKLIVDDGTARAALVCFNRPFLEGQFPPGIRVHVFGKFEYKYGDLQSSSFELAHPGSPQAVEKVLPVYPLTEGISQAVVRKLVAQALVLCAKVDDELPPSVSARRGLPSQSDALRNLHAPAAEADAEAARRALAYTELFYLQIMIGRRSLERKRETRTRVASPGRLARALLERLPFALTADQRTAVAEIASDMAGPYPMARLLQGDVGSGKTLVAFLAALHAIEAGGQAVILAPTELLARQHADTAARLLEPIGVRLAFLSGNVKDAARRPLLSSLRSGGIDLALGTHALFSGDVEYRDLRLVVVDEQHRFGVLQRIAMGGKGSRPDMLMMTATPIPRTLALTAYGDLAVSVIKTMPEGRKPIVTHLARHGNEERVYEFARRELDSGRQAYFVYPLIEASDKSDLKNAVAMFEDLAGRVYPDKKGALIHSRVPEEEKRASMRAFTKGELDFLVATSVVEVGVDVPNATCMVIEHAERFGLAALHQLRGRVGRGPAQSYCFLVYSRELTEDGKRRIMAMKENSDGFVLAEEDMRIRGPGEIAGTAQSGSLRLAFADPVTDGELLEWAREDATALLEADPALAGPEGSIVRAVLERASPFRERTAANG